ncbi:hypothetical protein ZWY2020_029317 [Hordeum vulgare]|nr:hypothetical protein ZWY2020_029317 [Hordeum vulgare]
MVRWGCAVRLPPATGGRRPPCSCAHQVPPLLLSPPFPHPPSRHITPARIPPSCHLLPQKPHRSSSFLTTQPRNISKPIYGKEAKLIHNS